MIHTIETRLKLNTTQEFLVDSCVVLWSRYYRKTWNRSSWYKNYMNYIKIMNEEVNPKVDEALLLPKELFNHEYDPFAINPS
jgi:hypothetical protein